MYTCDVSQCHSLQCKRHINQNLFLYLSIRSINMLSLQSVKNYVFVKKKLIIAALIHQMQNKLLDQMSQLGIYCLLTLGLDKLTLSKSILKS